MLFDLTVYVSVGSGLSSVSSVSGVTSQSPSCAIFLTPDDPSSQNRIVCSLLIHSVSESNVNGLNSST